MKFNVIVTHRLCDDSVTTKKMKGVEKVERTWDESGTLEVIRVYKTPTVWFAWVADTVLSINMTVAKSPT